MVGKYKISKFPHILEIIDAKFLQNIQDFFAETFDLPLVCFFNGDWLSSPSNHKDFCNKYIEQNKNHLTKCHNCHASWENKAKKLGKPVICKCHGGMSGLAVPLYIQGQYIGCVLSGQFLLQPLTDEILYSIMKNLNLDINDKLIIDMKKIKVMTYEQLNVIMDILDLIGNSIVSISYANTKFKEIGLNNQLINNKTINKWFSKNYSKTKDSLTTRECEILKHIAAGKNNNEIAKELFISVHTAKAHVSAIIEKFEVEDRVQVAVKAIENGFI